MRVGLRRVWPSTVTDDGLWCVGLAVAPGGAWLATGGVDGTVRLWHAASGRPHATLTGHRSQVSAVAISPDGRWVASAGADRTVRRWDVLTGTERDTLAGHRGAVCGVAIAPDGTWLATVGEDRMVRVWDAATGRLRATVSGHDEVVTGIAIAPGSAWFVTTSEDNTVRRWTIDREHPQWTARAPGQGSRGLASDYTDALASVSIARDGSWLATGGYDQAVRLWDAATGAAIGVLTGHTDTVTSVAIRPDGALIASASDDSTLRLWDSAARTEVSRVDLGCPLETVAWGSDGRSLFVAGAEGPARYDIEM